MRKHYDFSQAKPNPDAKRLKREITVRLDEHTVAYFEALSEETGIPYRTLNSWTCICRSVLRVGSGSLSDGSLRREALRLANALHWPPAL